MKLVGYRKTSFQPKDSTDQINGYNLYLTYADEKVVGEACERVFLTSAKMEGYKPEVGDNLSVVYNRYGKVDHLDLEE